jgi:hypothetical protein
VVEPPQRRGRARPRRGDRVEQRSPLRAEARVRAVDLDERIAQLREEALEPGSERRAAVTWSSARSYSARTSGRMTFTLVKLPDRTGLALHGSGTVLGAGS